MSRRIEENEDNITFRDDLFSKHEDVKEVDNDNEIASSQRKYRDKYIEFA